MVTADIVMAFFSAFVGSAFAAFLVMHIRGMK